MDTKPAPKKLGRACKDCHNDKCRCTFSSLNQTKCDRCLKQNRQCIPRISRQGERPKGKAREGAQRKGALKNPPLSSVAAEVAMPTMCVTQVGVAAGSLKDLQTKSNSSVPVPPPVAAWNNQLPSTLQPTVTPFNAALQELLTRSAANMTHDVSANANQSVLGEALNANYPALLELMKQGGNIGLMALLQPPQAAVNPYQALLAMQQQQQVPQKQALINLVEEQLKQRLGIQAISQLNLHPMVQRGGRDVNQLLHIPPAVVHVANPPYAQGINQHSLNQALPVPPPQGRLPNSDSASSEEQKSRLKKKKKAHLLVDMCNGKRSNDVEEPQPKKIKSDTSQPKPASTTPQAIMQPEDRLINHLIKIFAEHAPNINLQHHHGLQCLIRELIASSLSRRSFDLLFKASNLAVKFGIGMDQILSGLPRMDYLLPMLLAPRSKQVPDDSLTYIPTLPHSLLKCIGPPNCSSFDRLNVGNRWIAIREVCQGKTKFYCSPLFERNVISSLHMSRIYKDTNTDVFALIFEKEQYDGFLECIAKQIALRVTEDADTRPVRVASRIRLLSQSFGHTPAMESVQILDVETMMISDQTLDRHLCYVELFNPQNQGELGNNNVLPPSYDAVRSHW